ncbi:P-loop NTPase family protein [Methanoculleus bourgensis]|nr:hypothetical protein [Methanoculleus bourgensis]
MNAFSVEDLIERLDRLHARGPIPFDAKRGEILGILCPCGQDRRTLIAILMTTLFPLPGFAEHSPLAVLGNLGDVRRSMGIALQDPVLDPALTARENLEFQARLHGWMTGSGEGGSLRSSGFSGSPGSRMPRSGPAPLRRRGGLRLRGRLLRTRGSSSLPNRPGGWTIPAAGRSGICSGG